MLLQRIQGSAALRAAFFAAALLALVLALLPNPPRVPGNPSDKLQHAGAFAVLALLGALAYPRVSPLRMLVGLSLFGALIEIGQAIPALNRHSDPLDWVADSVGAAIGLAAVAWWRRGRR